MILKSFLIIINLMGTNHILTTAHILYKMLFETTVACIKVIFNQEYLQ